MIVEDKRIRKRSANDKLNLAGIGIGGQDATNLGALASENIVALCDVDLDYAAKTIAKYPAARVWTDYRAMLEEQKDIDATSSDLNPDTHPVASVITFRFAARGSLPPVKLTWYEGTRAPRP